MKAMTSEITIGDYVFEYVSSVSVESTWQKVGDTCTIELPNVRGQLDKDIRPGQEVIVRLGYDGLLVEEFRGYVVRVSPAAPLRIDCVDEIWKLRQETVSKSWKSVQLKDLLHYLAPGAMLNSVPQMTLAPFRLDRVTRAEALETIRSSYGLAVYFRGPQIFVGLPYTEQGVADNKYHLQQNCLVGSLSYRRKEDVRVKLTAISLKPDNTKITIDLGDKDGEAHTMHFYNLSESALKQQATEKMARLKFDGYSGSFTAFGQPNPVHSSVVHLQDSVYPERGGSYYVDKVVTSYSERGYRREITLGPTSATAQ